MAGSGERPLVTKRDTHEGGGDPQCDDRAAIDLAQHSEPIDLAQHPEPIRVGRIQLAPAQLQLTQPGVDSYPDL